MLRPPNNRNARMSPGVGKETAIEKWKPTSDSPSLDAGQTRSAGRQQLVAHRSFHADDDDRLWAVAADLATLGDVVQELIDRETFPTNAAPVADERAASNNPTPQ